MKFAIVNSCCGYGSTGRNVIKNYRRIVKYGHTAKIFFGMKRKYGEGNSDFVYFGNRILNSINYRIGTLLSLHGMLSFFSTAKLIVYLNDYQPDVVWLDNIHGDYVNEFLLLEYLKKKNYMTVYGMPDEYAFLGKCCIVTDCYKFREREGCHDCPHLDSYPPVKFFDNSKIKFKLKQRAYSGFNNIVFRSAPYVISNARSSTLLSNKEFWESDSSVDIENVFFPHDATNLRISLGISELSRVVLLCAPFSDPNKGGQFFLEAAKKCLELSSDVIFINVSFDDDKSICPNNFIPIPRITDQNELSMYYSLADAYVCTSLGDAQPSTCLEALGCGTPIIGFDTSGIPYIAPNEFGTYVEPKNIEQLVQAILRVKKKTRESIEKCHEYAKGRFSIQASESRYVDFLKYVIDKAIRRNNQ